MKRTMNAVVLIFGAPFVANGVAFAEPCASVEREMVQGQTAFEIAKDNSDYEEAAHLFKKATDKAPECADAYFNLGMAYEKTTDYNKAISALEKYLQLKPGAEDAAAVRKQIYRLEFLAKKKGSGHAQKKNGLHELAGLWRQYFRSSNDHVSPVVQKIEVAGEELMWSWSYKQGPFKTEYRLRLEGQKLTGSPVDCSDYETCYVEGTVRDDFSEISLTSWRKHIGKETVIYHKCRNQNPNSCAQ